jgi:hypothetical protein
MTTLFVIHESGRSLSLMIVARKLLEQNPQEKIIIFAVGHAAKDLLDQLSATDPLKKAELINYTHFGFSPSAIKHLEDHPLNPHQLEMISTYFNVFSINKIIIGSPSWLNALAPFQIAEAMARLVTKDSGFIYDGDFYKENGCAYWSSLEKPNIDEFAWRKKFTWLACMPGSAELIPAEIKADLSIKIVGDPSLDQAINPVAISDEERKKIREELEVPSDKELLIIQGSKYIKDDVQLVNHILSKKPSDQFEIRILLHKGTLDFNIHIITLSELFDTDTIKIVASSLYDDRIHDELYSNKQIMRTSRKLEVIADVADRLCSTIPGTQATKAAIKGIPVFCELSQHVSYLPKGRIKVGEDGLNEFLAADKVLLPTLNKTDLGLTNQTTADIVCGLLSAKKVDFVYRAAVDATLFGDGDGKVPAQAKILDADGGLRLAL